MLVIRAQAAPVSLNRYSQLFYLGNDSVFCNDSKQARIATIGGTFDTLHAGHKEYIRLAFEFVERVWIYVSADEHANRRKRYVVQPYEVRVEKLEEYLAQSVEPRRYQVRCLRNMEELQRDYLELPELRENIFLAVVSPEYYDFFQNLNAKRETRGLHSFLTLVKRRTLTADKRDLSSYEVRRRLPVNGKSGHVEINHNLLAPV